MKIIIVFSFILNMFSVNFNNMFFHIFVIVIVIVIRLIRFSEVKWYVIICMELMFLIKFGMLGVSKHIFGV